MYKKTKVLLIAPYEGLKEAVLGVLPQYQDKLELTMSLGDLTSGVQQAQTAQTQGYDVIISRGGTAELIARNVPLPVINIEISGYDYLRAIKLAENIRGRKAFVGFPYITARARSVNELLCTNVDIFTIHTAEEIAPLLKKLASEGYELIIGDVATCREAEELDISNLLLTSGEESLANAFDRAVALSEAFRRSTEQARLLQAIMQQAGERVVVLDAGGSIAYQTVELGSYALGVTDLEEFSHEAAAGREREVIVPRDEADLCVRVRQLELAGEPGSRAFYSAALRPGGSGATTAFPSGISAPAPPTKTLCVRTAYMTPTPYRLPIRSARRCSPYSLPAMRVSDGWIWPSRFTGIPSAGCIRLSTSTVRAFTSARCLHGFVR